MDIDVSGPSNLVTLSSSDDFDNKIIKADEKDRVRVKRKTLKAVLEQCQRALEALSTSDGVDDDEDDDDKPGINPTVDDDVDQDSRRENSAASHGDREADKLCNFLKSRVECPEFLEKLECSQVSVPQNIAEEGNSWDMVSENDLWEGEGSDSDQEEYVVVRQEDIVDGIACFMAAYLLSLNQTKELTPNQLQDTLAKTFSVKKKKGKLRKAWDGSKVVYNVASWGATAIGIYQNPVILRAASKAFWTSCHVISKLL